jgi:DNA-binding LacI/PurR family transcriptional regulator
MKAATDGSRHLSEADIRKIAVAADADPRTVRRVLNGEGRTRGMARDRVVVVLTRMGIKAEKGARK